MGDGDAPLPEPPTVEVVDKLIDDLDTHVLNQANVFVRELLRKLGLTLQPNKAKSREQLVAAVRAGTLTAQKLGSWLDEVEGWGNQHIYPFDVPPALARSRVWSDPAQVEAAINATFPGVWAVSPTIACPAVATLMRAEFSPERRQLTIEWHKPTESRIRAKDRDGWPWEQLPAFQHPQSVGAEESDSLHQAMVIDGDTYWFQAFRLRPQRSIMRFVVRLGDGGARNPVAALFLRSSITNPAHKAGIELAWKDLSKISIGRTSLDKTRDHQWDISSVIKRLDADAADDATEGFRSKKTRFTEQGASVEFTTPTNYVFPQVIADVHGAITDDAISNPDFVGSEADFRVDSNPAEPMSRDARIALFHEGKRIRIWTELTETDVWTILNTVQKFRT